MLRALALAAAALALTPGAAAAASLPQEGPDGRTLLGGSWSFQLAGGEVESVTVPHSWNAADDSYESHLGTTGVYVKRFRVADSDPRLRWRVRFESVNYRAQVLLNGRTIGEHRGAFLPWELPLDGVRRKGLNTLEVRVDNRRKEYDFPPLSVTNDGVPAGGWWNAGGILREVSLRPVRRIDVPSVSATPELPATVRLTVRLRGRGRARVVGRVGRRHADFGTVNVRGATEVTRRLRIPNPKLWTPEDPNLYAVRVDVSDDRGRRLAGYDATTGLREVAVRRGRLELNGEPLRFRGVGYHEDVPERGMALEDEDREWLVSETEAVGANLMRTHYPPSAQLHELADRRGVLLWSEVPVYQQAAGVLKDPRYQRRAVQETLANIAANGNHPSVLLWSIGNELQPVVGPGVGSYIAAATAAAKRADPSRPVGIAINGYPFVDCQRRYGPLDVIGVNEYFGWYTGPSGQLFDPQGLSPYLDQVRACYPSHAVAVTEFGAEANRDGPAEEKGTWAFQRAFISFHTAVFATKPWLSGVSYWALNEFRVRPEWAGGNPRPTPPVHRKGVITYAGERKPAWADLRAAYALR